MADIESIETPGKFEGEPAYAPAVWDVVMNGFADEVSDTETPVARVSVDSLPEDVIVPDGAIFFEAWEDDTGFVYTDVFCNHRHPEVWFAQCSEHPGCSMQGPANE